MFPQPMPWSEFPLEGPPPDLTSLLGQHLRAGFETDLAIDLVLNELVIRAAECTHASSAALSLTRGEDLICRAATGNFAPDLGSPLMPREGLSSVCLRTRQPQVSEDAENDPRVAVAFSRRFSVRSVLAVPVFDPINNSSSGGRVSGVLEVFSPIPAAFSDADRELLEAYAQECTRIRHAAIDLGGRKTSTGKAGKEPVFATAPIPIAPIPIAPWPLFEKTAPVGTDPVEAVLATPDSQTTTSETIQPETSDLATSIPNASAFDSIFDIPKTAPVESILEEPTQDALLQSLPVFPTSSLSSSLSSEIASVPIDAVLPLLPRPLSTPRILPVPEPVEAEIMPLDLGTFWPEAKRRPSYETWTLALAALAIFAIIGVSFLIGSRVGWLRATVSPTQTSEPAVLVADQQADQDTRPPALDTGQLQTKSSSKPMSAKSSSGKLAAQKLSSSKAAQKESSISAPAKPDKAPPSDGELVIYEKGKVVFRMKNQPGAPYRQSVQPDPTGEPTFGPKTTANTAAPTTSSAPGASTRGSLSSVSAPGLNQKLASAVSPTTAPPQSYATSVSSVWLDPAEAEHRLLSRAAPRYPPSARAAHRAGEVVLEVRVAEDGSVASVHTLTGDPLLAAAATQAVRNWRYQPYRLNDHPSQFHTDVTLNFSLSN